MNIHALSDDALMVLGRPILLDTIYGANHKDWGQFSRHMPAEDASSEEIKADVLRQWDEEPYLTTFEDSPQFLGVIRKSDCVVLLWKLSNSRTSDEYLERLTLVQHDQAVYQVGIWTD